MSDLYQSTAAKHTSKVSSSKVPIYFSFLQKEKHPSFVQQFWECKQTSFTVGR